MNLRIAFFAFGIAVAFALLPGVTAKAVNPHLVVMAVNSGGDLVAPYDFIPPTMTPGAKGFLIGVDTGDFVAVDALAVTPMTFSGLGLIHKQGIVNEGDPPTLALFPQIMTRYEANRQSTVDANNYVPEDTYLIDKKSSSMGWGLISVGAAGGSASDHFLTIYATPSATGGTPNGVYPLTYVVTTGDLAISGVIVRGGAGGIGWTPLGQRTNFGGTAVLDFASGTIVPEPTSLLLAALGMIGLLFVARRA